MMGTHMEERIARIIRNIRTLDELAQFEANARQKNALTDEIKNAIGARSADLGRKMILERTDLDLTDLSPAEEKIVQAVSEYVGVMKRQGKDATRTFIQLRNRGLIDAAETAVSKSTPTQGFKTLAEADLADLSYEQIVLDHPDEFSPRAIWFSRRTLGLANDSDKPPAKAPSPTPTQTEKHNPAWARDELILALDLYLRFRDTPPAKDSPEVAELSALLGKMGRVLGPTEAETYRNTNGVSMKMMNFRRLDPEYTAEGKVGLTRGNKLEEVVWDEFAADAAGLSAAVAAIRSAVDDGDYAEQAKKGRDRTPSTADPYWVFVCNPKKWAIDRFLDQRIERDTWGIRPSDRDRFAPGQLGIIRVGVDQRTVAERNGKPPLEAGIYALCEVESEAFAGNGASDEFWAPGNAREPGWPTVKIRYLRVYQSNPLKIERLRVERPNISPLLLNGFQAASFSISANDFRAVMALLGEDPDDLPLPAEQAKVTADRLAALEGKYLHASPEVKERISRTVERGPIGAQVKEATGFKCQLCETLGFNPVGFLKENGDPYVEAHHVMPVAKKEVGSLAVSNIMTLCANHHRQMHYGGIEVVISTTTFDFVIDGMSVKIPRLGAAASAVAPSRMSLS